MTADDIEVAFDALLDGSSDSATVLWAWTVLEQAGFKPFASSVGMTWSAAAERRRAEPFSKSRAYSRSRSWSWAFSATKRLPWSLCWTGATVRVQSGSSAHRTAWAKAPR